MPPRVPGASAPLAAAVDAVLLAQSTQSATKAVAVRCFSTTQPQERMNRTRYAMWKWMQGRGKVLETSGKEVKYVGHKKNQPFPLNPLFKSEPVLSEDLKETIWTKVVENGEAIKAVSQEYGVDVRRIGAVVRLKEVEKNMISKDEQLALPYSQAIMEMLPKTRPNDYENTGQPFEPINEVPMHPYTMQQLFVPVSESRRFTRADSAEAFHDHLLSADDRSYQKELIDAEREIAEGTSREEAMKRYRQKVQRVEEEHAKKMAEKLQAEADRTSTIETGRAAYRIKDIKVEDGGQHGKSPRGVGWRYGAPHQDRKRGLVKIPTQVP